MLAPSLFQFAISVSLCFPYPENLSSTDWTHALGRCPTILHGYALGIPQWGAMVTLSNPLSSKVGIICELTVSVLQSGAFISPKAMCSVGDEESKSSIPVVKPNLLMASATCAVTVVLPTPPFVDFTAIFFIDT